MSWLPTINRCWTRIAQQRIIPTPGVKAGKCWDWGVADVVSGQTLHLPHNITAAVARIGPG